MSERFHTQRGYLLIWGLSRGGTNLCAERLHALRGVASLSETASRFIQPGELDVAHGLEAKMVAGDQLPPAKPPAGLRYVSLNKINYALRCYPQDWLYRAASDPRCWSILLVRNPFEIHRSRINYVRRHKAQRVRWLAVEQLARDWREFARVAIELIEKGRGRIFLHERTAEDRAGFVGQVSELAGEAFVDELADVPTVCARCGGPLARKKRYDWDVNDWLWCPKCDLFAEGFGNYNYIREAAKEDFANWKSRCGVEELIGEFRPWLGEKLLEFCLADGHLKAGGERVLADLLLADRSRYADVPLDDILYPY